MHSSAWSQAKQLFERRKKRGGFFSPPDVDYQKMDDVGHFLMMEKPKEFNALMMAFLKKNGLVK